MTQRGATKRLARFLTITAPADKTAVIQAVMGNLVSLDVNLGADDIWEGCQLKVTSGQAKNDIVPIVSNHSQSCWISTGFDPEFPPHAGDTVLLTGGPLSQAVIEQFDMDSVVAEVNAGKKYFVTVAVPEMSFEQNALGRDAKTKGMRNVKRGFTFNVLCEVPDISGRTAQEAFDALTALPSLTEQVLARIWWFRSQASAGFSGTGPVKVAQGLWERDGGPTTLVAGIFFTVNYAR